MNNGDPSKKKLEIKSKTYHQIKTLCEEVMNNLYQAKALLAPIDEDSFFNRMDNEILRHYFYALETIINSALSNNEQIARWIDLS